jgi:hypothetical protein
MMGRSELLAKMEQEAAAWDSGSGDIAALLREAKADIEHLAVAAASHFRQAMLNGEKSNAYRHTLEAIARLDPEKDSPKGFNEWGEADCFNKAQAMASEVLGAA